MSWGLPFITPKQLNPVSLADALKGGIQFAQQSQNNSLINKGKDLSNQAAKINLNTLGDINNARLNSIKALTNLHNMSSRLIGGQLSGLPLADENKRLQNEGLQRDLDSKKALAERLGSLGDAFSGKDLSDKGNQYALAAQLAGIDPKEAVSLLGSLNKPINQNASLSPYDKTAQMQEAKSNESFEQNSDSARQVLDLANKMKELIGKTPDYSYLSSTAPFIYGAQVGLSDNFKKMNTISKNLTPLIRSIKDIPGSAMRTAFEQQQLADMALSPKGQSKESQSYQTNLLIAAAKQKIDINDAYQKYKNDHNGSGQGFRNSPQYNEIINRAPPPAGELTEQSINDTMKATGMTRKQVIEEYHKRTG